MQAIPCLTVGDLLFKTDVLLTRDIFSIRIPPMNDDVWKHRAELVRQKIANKKPVLTIKDVMEALGMRSKSTAENAMLNWERLGLVERVETGERKGTWHLV